LAALVWRLLQKRRWSWLEFFFQILKDIAGKARKIRAIKEENAWFRPFCRLEAKPRRISVLFFLVSTYRFSGQSFPGVRTDAHAVPKEPLAASATGVELGLAGGADVLVLQSAFQGGAAFGTIAALGGCSRRCLCCLIGGGHDVYTSFQSFFCFYKQPE